MAKTKPPTSTRKAPAPRTPKLATEKDVLSPERVCELLGLPAPMDPPRPPAPWPGYATFWDPGRSILDLRQRHPTAFDRNAWYDGLAFAKATDLFRWRQLRIEPLKFGQEFGPQAKAVPKGDEVPLARDVVTYLLIRFLATGDRWPGYRLRCRDVLPSGRRVLVGPFWNSGLDLANCGDRYRSPGIGLASANVPPPVR